MKILSFDCANKTLAYVYLELQSTEHVIEIITTYMDKIKCKEAAMSIVLNSTSTDTSNVTAAIAYNNNILNYIERLSDLDVEIKTVIDKIQDSFARIYAYGVIDILNGNNVNDVPKCERTVLLKCALDTIKAKVPDLDQCVILVEKQPPFGYNNTTVQDQIMMYFADYRIVEISASEKNKITLNDADNKIFKHANKNPRVANKKHSLYNTDRLTTLFNIKLLEEIKPALREHISDCFMQAVAYTHRVVNSKPN